MPNWVYTTATVSGSKSSLEKFRAKAAKPYTSKHRGVFIEGKGYDPDAIDVVEHKSDLSFWNFIAPTDLDAYFGPEKKPDNHETMTFDERMVEALQFKGDHWYDWNVRNWGTKWDACDVTCMVGLFADEAAGAITYSFSTAWSPAEGAFRAMVAQHPDLEFEFHCTEEQGWGVVYEGKDGELEETRSWDIPESHREWEDIGQEYIRCSYAEVDYLYEDCPKGNASANADVAMSE